MLYNKSMDKQQQVKIAFFGVKPWERAEIEKQIISLDSFGVGIFEKEVQEDLKLAGQYDVISTFIYSFMDKKVLAKLPNLKMIATRSTGMDHIDLSECKKRKIEVVSVPEYGSKTVAEFTMALMLSVSKKIVLAHQAVEDGYFNPEGMTGIDLNGKTVLVVGVGKIGENVVKYCRAFGMKVLGVDAKPDLAKAKKIGYRSVKLEEGLKEADIVTLHVPAIPSTFHMINRKNIKLLKPGSYLINTCRGPVIEVEALVWALNKGILAGAGLDVTEEEARAMDTEVVMNNDTTKDDLKELVSYHLLRDRDDVVFTPHNAFNTKEAIERIVETTVKNINKFIKK